MASRSASSLRFSAAILCDGKTRNARQTAANFKAGGAGLAIDEYDGLGVCVLAGAGLEAVLVVIGASR